MRLRFGFIPFFCQTCVVEREVAEDIDEFIEKHRGHEVTLIGSGLDRKLKP